MIGYKSGWEMIAHCMDGSSLLGCSIGSIITHYTNMGGNPAESNPLKAGVEAA